MKNGLLSRLLGNRSPALTVSSTLMKPLSGRKIAYGVVARALASVKNRAEVLDLRWPPPRRVGPAVRDDVDLLGARQQADGSIAPWSVALPADAAVQLEPPLIAPRPVGRP